MSDQDEWEDHVLMPEAEFAARQAEVERLREENDAYRDALELIRHRYFPVNDRARVEWAKQTFEIARAALEARKP